MGRRAAVDRPRGSRRHSPKAGQVPLRRRHPQNARELVSLVVLTIGYLQYYYLDVMVQIGSLQKVVFFVPLASA